MRGSGSCDAVLPSLVSALASDEIAQSAHSDLHHELVLVATEIIGGYGMV